MIVFHENNEINLRNGSGFFDVFNSVKDFVVDNKDTVKDLVGGVAGTVGGIKDIVTEVKEINKVNDRIRNIAEEVKMDEVINELKELQKMRIGKGFNYI